MRTKGNKKPTVPCPYCSAPLKIRELPATVHSQTAFRIKQRVCCRTCKQRWARYAYPKTKDEVPKFHHWQPE